ncbi:MAG: hypothetical protein ING31_05375 [Burkholderiales bacterium]|jgi:hypothetical protein|nr:hypothetical protein [Burkholderiales bacterium]
MTLSNRNVSELSHAIKQGIDAYFVVYIVEHALHAISRVQEVDSIPSGYAKT